MLLTAFPYIAKPDAKILILGSMPGQRSLDENEYYAHPRNELWNIISSICGFKSDLPYKTKCTLLLENKIALWDVMQNCTRKGSLDSAIIEKSIIVNDFKKFLCEHPNIQTIFFNGQKAQKSFKRHVQPEIYSELSLMLLPSTSPAHASMDKNKKLYIWSQALQAVLQRRRVRTNVLKPGSNHQQAVSRSTQPSRRYANCD